MRCDFNSSFLDFASKIGLFQDKSESSFFNSNPVHDKLLNTY